MYALVVMLRNTDVAVHRHGVVSISLLDILDPIASVACVADTEHPVDGVIAATDAIPTTIESEGVLSSSSVTSSTISELVGTSSLRSGEIGGEWTHHASVGERGGLGESDGEGADRVNGLNSGSGEGGVCRCLWGGGV